MIQLFSMATQLIQAVFPPCAMPAHLFSLTQALSATPATSYSPITLLNPGSREEAATYAQLQQFCNKEEPRNWPVLLKTIFIWVRSIL